MGRSAITHGCWACGAATHPSECPPGRGLWKCASCGLRFVPNRDQEEVRGLYNQSYFDDYPGSVYSDAPEQRSYEAKLRLRFLRRFVASGDLVEIGVAGGWFLDAARSKGFRVRGIEPAEEMAASARSRFGLDVVTAFVEDVALQPASADAVCAWHVLEHIPEPLASLRELHEMLRPGGAVALEVPNSEGDQAKAMGARWPHWDFAHHVSHFGPRSAAALLERAGFQDIHIETIHGADYHRPALALRPAMAAATVKHALGGGGLPRRPHPVKKELLRAVGRRPA